MGSRTHQTAIVVIPPEDCWEPIQRIRRRHDRHVRRWMPHITLLYPFRPRAEFASLAPPLGAACARLSPFTLHLRRFRHFEHRREHYTLWLAPEPAEPLRRLWEVLVAVVPDCDDTGRRPAGFTPHLSVGQVRGRAQLAALERDLETAWAPLEFTVAHVNLIWRAAPPDDVFRVGLRVPLGTGAGSAG